jgi:hypothetical protein
VHALPAAEPAQQRRGRDLPLLADNGQQPHSQEALGGVLSSLQRWATSEQTTAP